VDTGWLEREWRTPTAEPAELERAAIAAALLADSSRGAFTGVSDGMTAVETSAWRLAARPR
jgi:hypothetical protein